MGELRIAIVPVTPIQQNCAIVWDSATGRGAVVDPGGDVPEILAALDKLSVQAELIVLTHGHFDHAAGADELRAALTERAGHAVPIEGPEERDLFLLKDLANSGAARGVTDARPVQPDRWLHEGDTVAIGGHDFSVLHCPGHTPGHVVLVDAVARLAIVGDVLFHGSVGRTDLGYGDHAGLIDAIQTKLLPLGDDMAFICGHGPGSTFGEERQANPFLRTAAAG